MGATIGLFVLVFLMFRGIANSIKEIGGYIEEYDKIHKDDNNQK